MVTFKLIVDWNNDGVFSSTEDISTDIKRLSWTRGREAEMEETPPGTLTAELKDPNGDYSPHKASTKWGVGNVTLNREALAQAIYQGTTFGLFRGRIQSIRPQLIPGEQSATIFCVDGMEELSRKTLSLPVGVSAVGGAAAAGGVPFYHTAIGSTAGIIDNILDNASWAVSRRTLDATGAILDWWFTHNLTAKQSLDELERHDIGSIIFINSSGNMQYYSSTHFANTTYLASFASTDLAAWDYQFSARGLINSARLTAHGRYQDCGGALSTDLGQVGTYGLAQVASGATYVINIELARAPVIAAIVPQFGTGTTADAFQVVDSATGTALSTSQISFTGILKGASLLVCTLVNNYAGTVAIRAPALATDTFQTMYVRGSALFDHALTSTYSDSTYIDQYQRRTFAADYPYYEESTKMLAIAQNVVDRNKVAKPDYNKLTLLGSSTYNIAQILTREIGDKVRVTVGDVGVVNRDYNIYGGEWEVIPGKPLGIYPHLGVRWALVDSSGNSTIPTFGQYAVALNEYNTVATLHLVGTTANLFSSALVVELYDADSMYPAPFDIEAINLDVAGIYSVSVNEYAERQYLDTSDVTFYIYLTDTNGSTLLKSGNYILDPTPGLPTPIGLSGLITTTYTDAKIAIKMVMVATAGSGVFTNTTYPNGLTPPIWSAALVA